MVAEEIPLDPEDVVILNHPYEGGTHHPDINLVTDSGGPDRNRGGLGHCRHTRYLHGEGYYTNRSETSKFPPGGVLASRPGAPSNRCALSQRLTSLRRNAS